MNTRSNFFYRKYNFLCRYVRGYSSKPSIRILGLETSCDDTGCAILNEDGKILSQKIHSQHLVHLRNGGIIPDIAQDLHRTYIEQIVSETLKAANLSLKHLTAIAVTVKPGLPLSLSIGLKYAKYLARQHNTPLIPIHHMRAHALVERMNSDIPFPFLVLLISGGHCLLGVAMDVDSFILLGESMDTAPGQILDRVARDAKLRNLPEYSQMCGGQAIEVAASKAKNPKQFQLPLPLTDYKDCNFSFNGLKTSAMLKLTKKEEEHDIKGIEVIPEINDICAALLMAMTRHLVHRTQRAMEFCLYKNIIPENKQQLVVSGGVACNNIIFKGLKTLCDEFKYTIHRPPRELCTDNGVMIAWNGLEKWRANIDTSLNPTNIEIESNCPLGTSYMKDIAEARIRTKLIKLEDLI